MLPVTSSEQVFTVFRELLQERKYSYITFQIENRREFTVDLLGDKNELWDGFLSKLKPESPAYIVTDFNFKENDGSGMHCERTIFISW
jgi:hypothetical protein